MHKSGKNPKKYSLSNERHQTNSLNSPITRFSGPKKRTSLCILKRASLTVEAALLIPIFFMAVLCMAGTISIYSQTLERMVALRNKSEQAAVFSSLTESEIWIDLPELFSPRLLFLPDGVAVRPVYCRGKARAWTGRDPEELVERAEESAGTYVYVTENESVYHTSSACTHLALRIHPVSAAALGSVRNEGGGRYKPCEKCVGEAPAASVVYITDAGDRYHNAASCSGLKRTIVMKEISQIPSLRECSRCASQIS